MTKRQKLLNFALTLNRAANTIKSNRKADYGYNEYSIHWGGGFLNFRNESDVRKFLTKILKQNKHG